jgi:RimJ/RimL family protein N-acetyltransferase
MFQKIQTKRLNLRPLLPSDADTMFAYRSLSEICQYQSWEPKSVEEVLSFIDKTAKTEFNTTGWYQVGIALSSDGRLIGDCGIHFLESYSRTAEFGITIDPDMPGNGYAAEALDVIIKMLFTDLHKHRVFASIDPLNLPSMSLMKRLGLRQEAHFLQSLWFKDRWADDVVFAALESEWEVRN